MANKVSEFTHIADLLHKYGVLLTSKQKHALELYYFYDLSLGEISDELKISRAGVSDLIQHGEKKLLLYEEKLKLQGKDQKINNLLDKLNENADEPSRELIEKIKDILKYGI